MNPFIKTSLSVRAARCLIGLAVGGLAALSVTSAQAGKLYYADIFFPDASYGFIRVINDDGTDLHEIQDTGGDLRSVAVDKDAGKIYWLQAGFPSMIRRANLDGTNAETLLTTAELPDLQFPSAMAIDPKGGKMYWGDQVSNGLWRANLDGSDPQLLRNTGFHRGIALDLVNGKVYWSTSDSFLKGKILRCNLDGPGLETVVSSNDPEFKPNGIALDLAGGRIYWTDYVVDFVRRANLDGTDIQDLFAVGANLNPLGITLDLDAGKVYWGQSVDFESYLGAIMRMDLDGAFPETFLPGTGLPNSLVVVADDDKTPPCLGDIAPKSGDGNVNVDDLLVLLAEWGPNPGSPADFNGDTLVNVDDLLTLLAAWGQCK